MKKRTAVMLTVSLSAAVLALAFTGCQKKTAAGGAAAGAGGKTVSIKVEVFDRGTDGGKTNPANNQWSKWIHDKLLADENIDLTFVPVNRGDEASALINLMAAGSPPDVCLTYASDNITSWGNQGGLFDMKDYLYTTLKDLDAFLGPDLGLPGRRMIERQRDNATGAVYAIPARRMNVARLNTFIRKDWLDKLGLPLPADTGEFHQALIAFRDNAASLNDGNVIPFILSGARVDWEAGTMLDSFVDPAVSDKERWVKSAIERSFVVPGYKEGVRFLNTLYNENLVWKDFAIQKDDNEMNNQIKSGSVGAFIHNWDQIYRTDNLLTDLRKNKPGALLVPVDCFTSSDGLTHKTIYDAAGVFFFIPRASKNPEAAMRYLNWLSKYENYHFIQVGPEGIVHEMVDGVPKLNPQAGGGWIQNSAQNIDYTVMMNGLFLGSDEENIRALAAGYSWPADLIVNAYELALRNGRPPIIVSPSSPLSAAGPLGQTLTDKAVVVYTQSITAPAAQFDAVYDDQVEDWLALGAQKVIDERAEKYVAP